jgi:hypothetical protein
MLVPMGLIFLIFYLPADPAAAEAPARSGRDAQGDRQERPRDDGGRPQGKVVGITDDVLTIEIAALKSGESIRVKVSRAKVEAVRRARRTTSS